MTIATTGPNGINSVNGVRGSKRHRQRPAKPEQPARPKHTVLPEQPARPEHTVLPEQRSRPERPANSGPFAEDEVTEWFGTAAKPQPGAKPEPAVTPAAGQPHRRGRAVLLVALAVVLAAAGSLTVIAVRHFAGSSANSGASAALLRDEAAVRDQVAAWVAQQVSQNSLVSCDPVMCHALTAHGFPAHDLLVLGPTSQVPGPSAVVVETQAVQSLFGSSLATAWAPAVLASFGSGAAEIIVRLIAKNGAAAYRNQLNADMAAREQSGHALLGDNQIAVTAQAQAELATGQVDSRLMLAIAALAGHQPISILDFGNTGPGVDAELPLRFADLAESDQASHLGSAAYVRSMRSYLSTVNAQDRPARTETVLVDGQDVLRVEFTAPSPLGVFGLPG